MVGSGVGLWGWDLDSRCRCYRTKAAEGAEGEEEKRETGKN